MQSDLRSHTNTDYILGTKAIRSRLSAVVKVVWPGSYGLWDTTKLVCMNARERGLHTRLIASSQDKLEGAGAVSRSWPGEGRNEHTAQLIARRGQSVVVARAICRCFWLSETQA